MTERIPSSFEVEKVNCAICGNDDTALFVRGTGLAQIVRCRSDHLVYVNPRPARGRVREAAEHFVRDDNRRSFDMYRGPALRREARTIQSLKAGGNLLDIGCATGSFFEPFRNTPWKLFGVEPCLPAAETARERFGADVFCGDLREASWPAEFFDVVSVLDTFYYFAHPLAELLEIKRVLKPDGILAIEIPGYTYKLLRERGPLCWLIDCKWSRLVPESMHLYHYSPQTFGLLLQRAGFRTWRRIPEQAPLGRSIVADLLTALHLSFAQAVEAISRGTIEIAAKEFYLCRKL